MGEQLPVSLFFSEGSDSATPEADQGVFVAQRFRGGLGLRLPTHGDSFRASWGCLAKMGLSASECDPRAVCARRDFSQLPPVTQAMPRTMRFLQPAGGLG